MTEARSLRVGLWPIADNDPLQQIVVSLTRPDEMIAITLDEAPGIVRRLLELGHPVTARSIADAWFVGLAQRAGHTNFVLGPG